MVKHYQITAALQRRRQIKRDLELIERYRQGYSTTEIARRFSLDRCHVLKIVRELRKQGIEMSTKKREPWPKTTN